MMAATNCVQYLDSPQVPDRSIELGNDSRAFVWVTCLVGLLVFVIWRRRRHIARNLPA